MLATTIVHVCARCGSEHIRKNGHAENGGQCAKCLDCERTFILRPQGERYDQKFKDQVLAACQDRMSIRGITRPFGVCYQTVIRRVGKKRQVSRPSWTRSCPLGTATGSNSMNFGVLWVPNLPTLAVGGAVSPHAPDRGLDLGRPKPASACDPRAALPKGYRGRATRNDYWDAFAAAFPKQTHRACGKHEGETNHVERWFGTLRARTSRLVRRAYSFSKNAENHLDAIHLFIVNDHLAVQQKTTAR